MSRRARMVVAGLVVLSWLSSATGGFAAPASNPLGKLPQGVSFTRIETATTDQIPIFTALAGVSRMTWGREANFGGECYEGVTGGPEIILIEKGTLRIFMSPASEQKGDLPRLLRKGSTKPVSVLPNTKVNLDPGDLMAFPNGSSCGMYGPLSGNDSVTFLRIRGLTSYLESQTINYPEIQMAEQVLDLNFGVATTNPPAPASVVLGSLTLAPGAQLPLSALTVPIIFALGPGQATLTTNMKGGVVRRSGTEDGLPSEDLPRNTAVTLNEGDASYVLPGTKGSLTNSGSDPLTLWVVAVVP